MKVRMSLLAALLCLLLLTACGQGDGPAAPEFQLPEGRRLEPLSLEQSQAMARFLNANRVCLEGDALYCYEVDGDWQPVLARYTWDGKALTDFSVLAEGCVPEYLCRLGDYLYYIERGSGSIERVPLQGGQRELVRPGPCEGLLAREGQLCFRSGEGRFLALDPASGTETLLLGETCAWAYPLEGAILYLSAGEESRLRLFWTEEGLDEALSVGPASTPLILENRLYYRSGELLHAVDLDGENPRSFALPETDGAIELLPEAGGLCLRGIRDGSGPAQWEGLPEGPFRGQPRGYRICDWLGGGVRVDTVYEADGRIRCFLLTREDGGQISFLAGRSTEIN